MDDTAEQIEEAKNQGWKEDFEGDNKKSAAEFIHDGRFFKQIDELKTKNKKLSQSFDRLTSHYEKVRHSDQRKAQADYESKIEQLKSEKVVALDEGDNRRVVEIDDAIRTAEKPIVEEPTQNKDFENWVKDNDWYDNSEFLRVEADSIGEQYFNQGLRGAALFTTIEKHIKRKYPNDFENENRSRPAAVEGGSHINNQPNDKPNGNATFKDLTREEQKIFNEFKADGIFKSDDMIQKYYNDVIEVR